MHAKHEENDDAIFCCPFPDVSRNATYIEDGEIPSPLAKGSFSDRVCHAAMVAFAS